MAKKKTVKKVVKKTVKKVVKKKVPNKQDAAIKGLIEELNNVNARAHQRIDETQKAIYEISDRIDRIVAAISKAKPVKGM